MTGTNRQEPTTEEAPAIPGSVAAAVSAAVSVFGSEVVLRFAGDEGEPEDQMRGPLEVLIASIAKQLGVVMTTVGEASLSDLRVRPDYAVKVNGAVTGYLEVKAPGKGADPTRWKKNSHDFQQWVKLQALPNVLYTDGQEWALYRMGEQVGELVRLTGDVRKAGAKLATADDGLAERLSAFLHWKPVAPRHIRQLVRSVAPLTRLLRDEVLDTLAREKKAVAGPFTELAEDWRALLFPEAEDSDFADGYAQSVTFALLLARTEKIDFTGKPVEVIAKELGKTHSLLGKALAILTDETIGALAVTLDTLVRVISVVDFDTFAKHIADPYLALYEQFLQEYDPELRKKTGSYYTPAAVVSAMTRLTDQVLRTRLGRKQGFASEGVTIVDPAMGTGTYVLDVLKAVADTVADAEGPGAVPARLRDTVSRLVGIEIQTGPFAVAELRVSEALHHYKAGIPANGLRLYVADTLDDPYAEQAHLAATMAPIAASRKNANKMKAEEPVLVVIGNPPYRERAKGHGGFIEQGAPNTNWEMPLLDSFREPGNGRNEYVLSNLYIYFWRWATWKVFDAHPGKSDGVICFITTSGYLKGPGFAGMRRYLREHASEGWVIDCTPEGHQPDVATRIFDGVQQPVCIGMFVRRDNTDLTTPATIHYQALHGEQKAKFAALAAMQLDGEGWETVPTEWAAPFLPAGEAAWDESPSLGDLMPWQSPGVKPNRTWVYAPLAVTLEKRWDVLVNASAAAKPALFVENRDATLTKSKLGLPGFPDPKTDMAHETGGCPIPVPVAYRTFDVQYMVPDSRVLSTPRTDLWRVRGPQQVYVSEQHDQEVKSGPALVFSGLIPDMHFYAGRGGRALPLYASADTSTPNLAPGLLDHVAGRLGITVTAEDFLAYIAGVTAHPAFTERFAEDLRTPGIRVPLTEGADIWAEAVALGRRVLWLHTRGERYIDPKAGRPAEAPDIADAAKRPRVTVAIPGTADLYPDELTYDADTQTLSIGEGRITPVPQRVMDYEVSGMNVVRKWFGYRRATRPQARGEQSALDDVRPETWPPAYTTDLLQLLRTLTLVTELEPEQAELLDKVLAAERITVSDLMEAGVLPVPTEARSPLPKLARAVKATGQAALDLS